MLLAAPLAALALGAVGSWQLGLRSEVRGVAGVPSYLTVPEPPPYEISPSLSFALEAKPDAVFRAGYSPRFVLLSGAHGGYGVESVSQYHEGSASVAWRATHGLQLYLAGSGSFGLLEVSPLTQASAPSGTRDPADQPGVPGQPSGPDLQPLAGIRSARYSSLSVGAGFDLQVAYRVGVGGTVIFGHSGGTNTLAREVFPLQNSLVTEVHTGFVLDSRDRLSLRGSVARTTFPARSTGTVLGLSTRWDRRVTSRLSGHAAVGVSTSQDSNDDSSVAFYRRILPRLEAGLQQSAPPHGRGIGYGVFAVYEPSIDPFSNKAIQRAQVQLDFSWIPLPWLGVTTGVASATAIRPGILGPSLVAGSVGLWSRGRTLDLGLVYRVGFQEQALPQTAPWQWSVGLVATYWRKDPI